MTTIETLLAGPPAAAACQDPADPAMDRIRTRLGRLADSGGLLDIAYRTLDTPVGSLLLAATGAGLLRVAYPAEDHDAVLAALASQVSPRILRAPARLDAAARQLDEYFTAGRRGFDLPLDLQLAVGFRRIVLEHLPATGYGQTISYAGLAAAAGRPRAVRAAATACATNPLPLILPCHRVIRSDGTPGGYIAGPGTKVTLLTHEHALIGDRGAQRSAPRPASQ
jgi:methylated-DNA-[protein]-cysteine S-methyltransferase